MGRRGRFVRLLLSSAVAVAAVLASVPAAASSARSVGLDRARAKVGETVNGRGAGFLPALPAEVRLGSPDGKLLWAGSAGTGTFTFSFATPEVAAGRYTIFAFNTGAAEEAARTTLEVLPKAAAAKPGAPAVPLPGGAQPAPPPPAAAPPERAQAQQPGAPQRAAGAARGPSLAARSAPVDQTPVLPSPLAPLVADADPYGPSLAAPEAAVAAAPEGADAQLAVGGQGELEGGLLGLLRATRASDGLLAVAAALLLGVLRRQRPRPLPAAAGGGGDGMRTTGDGTPGAAGVKTPVPLLSRFTSPWHAWRMRRDRTP